MPAAGKVYPAHHVGMLGLVAAILVDSLVSYPLHLPLNGVVFWLALGILANREFGRGKNQVKTDQ